MGDKSRVVENKRLNNLRRKCEDFRFTTHYGKGSDNLTDAISRIESWSEKDKDRFPAVSDHEDEGFRINSTQIQQCSVSRRMEGEFRMMKAALTNLKNKSGRRKELNPVETIKIVEESWTTYPNKLKILLDVYGGQQESDKQITDLHNSIAEFDSARSRKINAGLRDSARCYYILECGRRNKNVRRTELKLDKEGSGEIKFCYTVDNKKWTSKPFHGKTLRKNTKKTKN